MAHQSGPDRRMPVGRALRIILAGTCLMIACGGDPAPAGSGADPAAASAPQTSGSVDPCTLVTGAEASKALGVIVSEPERPKEANIPPRLVTCRYVGPRGQGLAVMTVMVRRGESASESQSGFRSMKEQLPGAEAVAGLGDDAFYFGDQLNVLAGTAYLNIAGDFDLATARSLAATALQRLK